MIFSDHFSRLKSALEDVYNVYNTAPWIAKYTKLNGKPYSFTDYEYQLDILADKAPTTIGVKPAQVGFSELSYRYAVALTCTQDDFNVIYTFPSSSDAEKNNRTRIDPMVTDSPELARLIDPDMNNSEMKKFGRNSFLFFKGTRSATQALSTPANCVINDEFDKSDITQASVYVSRLQNRPHKLRKIFSTPTIEKYGVSKEAETAKRFRHIATCSHCNHKFIPNYFTDIVVPGWDKSLEEITKTNIHLTRWHEAYLACPRCGKDPNLHPSRMEFVCENSSENHEAHAYFLSPFSVPKIITPSYLVNSSTKYEKYSEFKNQGLGITGEEKEEAITATDLTLFNGSLDSSELHVMGSDLGLTCHIVVGRESQGTLLIVHRETCHYSQFEERTRLLSIQYRVTLHVMDSQPYTDLVTRICKQRPNHWGAIFVNSKSTQPFTLEKEEEDLSKGKMALSLVKVNRTVALDHLLGVIKQGNLLIQSSSENENYQRQMLSLKRVQKFTSDGELAYVWEKTGDENDHYHFATLYFWVATKLRGTATSLGAASLGIPLISAVKGPNYPTHLRS